MARTGDRKLEVTILGDSTSVENALRRTDAAAERTTVKIAGFEKSFRSAGVAAGIAAEVTSKGFGLLESAARAAGDAIIGYNASIERSEKQITSLAGSQTLATKALALARSEADAGRGTYEELLSGIAALIPVARRTGADINQLYQTILLLSTLNSGPEGGVEGAIIAVSEALAGQWTSAVRRFNLPLAEIDKLKSQGIPPLEILNRVLAQSGVTMDAVTAQSQTFTKQQAILIDSLKQAAAEGGKPIFDTLLQGIKALNAALKEPASKSFVQQLAEELQVILTGNFLPDLGLQVVKALYISTEAYNQFLKAISGGKVEVNKDLLASFRKLITDQEGRIKADVTKAFGQPVAAVLSGADGGPLAPSAVTGYGQAVLRNYLEGLTPQQASAFDQISGAITAGMTKGSDEATAAASLIVVALKEIDQQGQISETTLYRLTTSFGGLTPEVIKLLDAYRALSVANQAATVAASNQAAAQAAVNTATSLGDSILASYQAQLDAATRAAEQHAAAHTGITNALQGEITAVQNAAQATAQSYQDQTAALQAQAQAAQEAASAHAEANAAAVSAAQTELAALQATTALHQGLLDAVLKGETAEYLAQQDAVDELTRKTAERWEAEIGGARRAKEGANKQVTDLTRAGNREDLDYIHKINAARAAGNEREARRLEREKAAADKKRAATLETARAEAAVANDNFAIAQEQVSKEAKALQTQDDAATKVAAKRLGEVKDQADAQAKADQAAIKGIQDAITEIGNRAAASARASQKRITEINDEIARENVRYGIIAAGDRAAASALSTLITQRRGYWQQETTQLGNVARSYEVAAKNAKEIADQTKTTYDYLVKIYDLYKNNPPGSPTGPPAPKTQTSPYDESPPSVPPGSGSSGGGGAGQLTPGDATSIVGHLRRTEDASALGVTINKIEIAYYSTGEPGSAADLSAFGRAAGDGLYTAWQGIVRAGDKVSRS